MRRAIAAAIGLLVVVALVFGALLLGTGDDDPTADDPEATPPPTTAAPPARTTSLEQISVTGDGTDRPAVTFEAPVGVDVVGTRVLTAGVGERVAETSTVTFDYMAVDGGDGDVLQATYGDGPLTIDLASGQLPDEIVAGLVGSTVGSRLLVSTPPSDAAAAGPLLFVFDVRELRTSLGRAEGTPVTPPAGLPTVALDAEGRPTITTPATAPPGDLVVQPLIVGAGAPVEAGQTLLAHYTGIIWGGDQFDSSWERGQPATFEIGAGRVIDGWDEGLVGQPIGSQVLLVVPPAKGYPEGNPDAGIAATDTIVFVVDVLDAY